MQQIRFDGRAAIVTGAGAGLGRAHAMLLAARGAMVVVNDLGRDAAGNWLADAVAAEIRAAGGSAVADHGSVAEPDQADEMVATALRCFGRIDIVVNNAGILRDKSFARMDVGEFELVLRVHLLGSAFVTGAAWPHLLQQKYGRIVFTTSANGLGGSYGQANYGAAKAGMVGLMSNLKNEGAKHNVLVNCVSPVATTSMTADILPPHLARMAMPEHVAPAVAWLCSESCTANGEIFAAGAGHYASVVIMKTAGVTLSPDAPATIEDFVAALPAIRDQSEMQPYLKTLDARVRRILDGYAG